MPAPKRFSVVTDKDDTIVILEIDNIRYILTREQWSYAISHPTVRKELAEFEPS